MYPTFLDFTTTGGLFSCVTVGNDCFENGTNTAPSSMHGAFGRVGRTVGIPMTFMLLCLGRGSTCLVFTVVFWPAAARTAFVLVSEARMEWMHRSYMTSKTSENPRSRECPRRARPLWRRAGGRAASRRANG